MDIGFIGLGNMGAHMARRLEAKTLGVPMDVIEAVARRFQLTCDELGSDQDITAVV